MTQSSAIQAKPHPGGTATFAGRTVSRIGFGAMQLDRLKEGSSLFGVGGLEDLQPFWWSVPVVWSGGR